MNNPEVESAAIAESFEERRKIFKDIWDSDPDPDDLVKTRIIKTAKFSNHVIGNRKKRVKNLKTVCKKILQLSEQKKNIDDEINSVITTKPRKCKSRHGRRRKKTVKEIKSSSSCSKNLPQLIMSEVTSESKNVSDEISRKPSLVIQKVDVRDIKPLTKTFVEGNKQRATVKFYLRQPVPVQRELLTITTINLGI